MCLIITKIIDRGPMTTDMFTIYLKSITFNINGLIDYVVDFVEHEAGNRIKNVELVTNFIYDSVDYNNNVLFLTFGEIEKDDELEVKFMNTDIRQQKLIQNFVGILISRFKIKNDRIIFLTLVN
jgi:uncharacterized 2Fe-2S/4Fe-4S cluster protein (DUF4445 family)